MNGLEGTVVLDNGGYNVKAAVVPGQPFSADAVDDHQLERAPVKVYLNAVARLPKSVTNKMRRGGGQHISNEIYDAPTYSGLFFRRPIEKGYIKEWDLQRDIWNYIFNSSAGLKVDPRRHRLVVTEPVACPLHIRRAMDELVFEEHGFSSYAAVNAAAMAARHFGVRDGIVLDSGFSATHAVPVINGVAYQSSARRLDLGGKVLTNHLKEMLSFRSWNLMDEFMVVNAIKENLCYVARDFLSELEATRATARIDNPNTMEYVLPELAAENRFGYARKPGSAKTGSQGAADEPSLLINNERICLPEALFNPSDQGLYQGGVHLLVNESIQTLPDQLRGRMYDNIMLCGGNCKLPGFRARFEQEMQAITPDEFKVCTVVDTEPDMSAIHGAIDLALSDDLKDRTVTKAEYQEHGHRITVERFYGRCRLSTN